MFLAFDFSLSLKRLLRRFVQIFAIIFQRGVLHIFCHRHVEATDLDSEGLLHCIRTLDLVFDRPFVEVSSSSRHLQALIY